MQVERRVLIADADAPYLPFVPFLEQRRVRLEAFLLPGEGGVDEVEVDVIYIYIYYINHGGEGGAGRRETLVRTRIEFC